MEGPLLCSALTSDR